VWRLWYVYSGRETYCRARWLRQDSKKGQGERQDDESRFQGEGSWMMELALDLIGRVAVLFGDIT
jgi:hypothetical protein